MTTIKKIEQIQNRTTSESSILPLGTGEFQLSSDYGNLFAGMPVHESSGTVLRFHDNLLRKIPRLGSDISNEYTSAIHDILSGFVFYAPGNIRSSADQSSEDSYVSFTSLDDDYNARYSFIVFPNRSRDNPLNISNVTPMIPTAMPISARFMKGQLDARRIESDFVTADAASLVSAINLVYRNPDFGNKNREEGLVTLLNNNQIYTEQTRFGYHTEIPAVNRSISFPSPFDSNPPYQTANVKFDRDQAEFFVIQYSLTDVETGGRLISRSGRMEVMLSSFPVIVDQGASAPGEIETSVVFSVLRRNRNKYELVYKYFSELGEDSSPLSLKIKIFKWEGYEYGDFGIPFIITEQGNLIISTEQLEGFTIEDI